MSDIKVLCDQVRQTAFQVHAYLGHGHLEKVYKPRPQIAIAELGV